LLETEAGLVLLDYKTDRIVDETTLSDRVTGYAAQLQLYAHAAGQLFDRPVSRAVLVFLCARRLVDVPCTSADAAAVVADLTSALASRGAPPGPVA
jgi:hypothetical protein